MATKKITLQVPQRLWANFTVQTKRLFINRAPFLDHMLGLELDRVSEELGDYQMSPKARRYISGQLAKADAKPINIEIQEQTAFELNRIVEKHGLVRDALICRLIIFLRASDTLLEYLEMPKDTNRLWGGVMAMSTSPLTAMEEIYSNPLYYIRDHLRTNWKCGVYDCELPRSWDWAVCLIKDEDVPGTLANIKLKTDIDIAAAFFDSYEKALFSADAKPMKGLVDAD